MEERKNPNEEMDVYWEGKAEGFARAAHHGQRRRYGGAPYIVHPMAVVHALRWHFFTGPVLAAAWLHDVVEDTQFTIDDIGAVFTEDITRWVDEMTSASKRDNLQAPRAKRKL